MANIYGRARNPLATRPSPVTGTMDQWKTWADGLTRSERDQLYPGMHIDLIPAYEVINQKAALPDTGTGFGTPMATHPGFAAGAKPVSPFGPSTPQGSSAFTGLFNGGYGGAHSAGLSAPANPQTTPQSPLYGSSPLQTPSHAAPTPFSGAPGLPGPGRPSPFAPAAFGFTPNMLNTPFGSPAPASTGFGTGAAPQQHPSALGSTPTFGLASFASSLTAPALPGNPSGTAIKRGLLDLSYTASPEGASPKSLTTQNGPPKEDGSDSTSENAEYGVRDAWAWLGGKVNGVWEATAEGYRFGRDFAKFFMEAPQEEQTEFLKELAVFTASFNPAIGGGLDIWNMINSPESRTAGNIALLIVGFLPGLRIAKGGIRLVKSMKRKLGKWRRTGEKGRKGDRDPDKRAPHFTRTPEVMDLVKGSLEAIAVEVFFQLFPTTDHFKALIRGEDVTLGELDLLKAGAAGVGGAGAGVSSGFESEDSANLVMQFLVDFPNVAIHTWLMKVSSDRKFTSEAALLGASATIGAVIVNVIKIILFDVTSKLVNKRLSKWSPETRRTINRWLKITINRAAEEWGDRILAILPR